MCFLSWKDHVNSDSPTLSATPTTLLSFLALWCPTSACNWIVCIVCILSLRNLLLPFFTASVFPVSSGLHLATAPTGAPKVRHPETLCIALVRKILPKKRQLRKVLLSCPAWYRTMAFLVGCGKPLRFVSEAFHVSGNVFSTKRFKYSYLYMPFTTKNCLYLTQSACYNTAQNFDNNSMVHGYTGKKDF